MPGLYKTPPCLRTASRFLPNDLILEKMKFLPLKIRKSLVHKYFFRYRVQIRSSTIDSLGLLPKNFIIREGNNSKHVTGVPKLFL